MFVKPGDTVRFWVFYQSSSTGLGVSGLTVKVAVNRGTTSVSGIAVSDSVSASFIDATNQPGLYYYDYLVPAAYYGGLHASFTTTDTSVVARGGQSLYISVAWLETIDTINGKLPALVGGRVDASVGAVASGAITSSAFGSGAITDTVLASGAITAAKLAADAATEIADAVGNHTVPASPTADTVDALLRSAGGAGDPWSTNIRAGIAAGTYGSASAAALMALFGAIAGQILSPANPSGDLTIKKGTSYTGYSSLVYNCRLPSTGFDESTNPIKLFVDYGNGSALVKTIGVGAIAEGAEYIQVDLAPTLTSAVTRDMPVGNFPAQIVAFNGTGNAEANIIFELTIHVEKPGFNYSASDT